MRQYSAARVSKPNLDRCVAMVSKGQNRARAVVALAAIVLSFGTITAHGATAPSKRPPAAAAQDETAASAGRPVARPATQGTVNRTSQKAAHTARSRPAGKRTTSARAPATAKSQKPSSDAAAAATAAMVSTPPARSSSRVTRPAEEQPAPSRAACACLPALPSRRVSWRFFLPPRASPNRCSSSRRANKSRRRTSRPRRARPPTSSGSERIRPEKLSRGPARARCRSSGLSRGGSFAA